MFGDVKLGMLMQAEVREAPVSAQCVGNISFFAGRYKIELKGKVDFFHF